MKYQAIVTSHGIIAHLFGQVEGLNHCIAVLTESCILDIFDIHAYGSNRTSLQIDGDPAYGIHEHLISPPQGAAIAVNEQLWNQTMSKLRIVVKLCFKEILQIFIFLILQEYNKYFFYLLAYNIVSLFYFITHIFIYIILKFRNILHRKIILIFLPCSHPRACSPSYAGGGS